jgi:hypothetical protein
MRSGALALAIALLCGCAAGRVPRVGEVARPVPDAQAEASYQRQLAQASGHAELYDRFDTRMFAAATLQTPAFVEARVRRKGIYLAQTPAEVEAALKAAQEETAGGVALFLGVHVTDARFDDFDKKGSVWRVALVTPQGEVTPEKIERVGRSNIDLRALYPYLDEFWTGYQVRFPKIDGSPLTLRLASTLGKAELKFPEGG